MDCLNWFYLTRSDKIRKSLTTDLSVVLGMVGITVMSGMIYCFVLTNNAYTDPSFALDVDDFNSTDDHFARNSTLIYNLIRLAHRLPIMNANHSSYHDHLLEGEVNDSCFSLLSALLGAFSGAILAVLAMEIDNEEWFDWCSKPEGENIDIVNNMYDATNPEIEANDAYFCCTAG